MHLLVRVLQLPAGVRSWGRRGGVSGDAVGVGRGAGGGLPVLPMGAGCWVLGAGFWVLDDGCWVLRARC